MNIAFISSTGNIANGFLKYCQLKDVQCTFCEIEDFLEKTKDGNIHYFDIVVFNTLDIDYVVMDICDQIIKKNGLKVILVAENVTPDDEHLAFEIGCIDYIKKPYSMQSLHRRISYHFENKQSQIYPKFKYNTKSRNVYTEEGIVSLTNSEHIIFEKLMNSDDVVSRMELLVALGKKEQTKEDLYAISHHIKNLRRKLPEFCIITVRGVGYYISK